MYKEVFCEKFDTLTRYFDIFGYAEPSQPTLNGDINNGNGCLNMSSFLVKAFTIISGVCSIAGFVVLMFNDKDKFFFVVTVYSVAITAFFIALGIMVYRALGAKFKDRPYRKIATMQTFTCNDGLNVAFETRRLIQSKTPFLDEVECKSKWLGQNLPVFKVNDVQRVYHRNPDPNVYDIEKIKLDKIVPYNETMSYKTTFECTFSDHTPMFGCVVDEPTEFIQFRILLGYKTAAKPAGLYKRCINPGAVSRDIFIENVDFDKQHRLYFKFLEKPEMGYSYFIKWDK